MKPTVTAIAPWYGSNRTLAHLPGAMLAGCQWVGVPFAGGMSELLHITATTVVVADLHHHILNLAAVVADPEMNEKLRDRLAFLPYHPDIVEAAQRRCEHRPPTAGEVRPDLEWAVDYFVSAWMSRNGCAGTRSEFAAGQSVRWCAGGGDSATRFRNATASLAEWCEVMRRCTFVRRDVFEFLASTPDRERHGLYLDPPFPGPGDKYAHPFTTDDQRRLAAELTRFRATRVVVRYYDHPLIRDLYAAWHWHRPTGGRTQANAPAPEVLLTNWRYAG